MNVSVILGHPYPQSFNHAIAATAQATLVTLGHTVFFHDLCEEGFDPLISKEELASGKPSDPLVLQHMQELREADGIIIVHPNWWGQPPAVLKGWVDRVLRNGVGYTFPEGDSGSGLPIGILPARTGLVFNTSNTSEERELQVFGDPLERIWKDCIFDFCGVKNFERRMYRIIADSSEADRAGWLAETAALVHKHFG